MINWPLLALVVFVLALGVRSWWRRAAFRLRFESQGDHGGKVAIVWFHAYLRGWGGVRCWLWLPGPISRRLWLCKATSSGRLARWLRAGDR